MNVKIVTNGTKGQLYIDGEDFSSKCAGYSLILSQNPCELPVLNVTIVPTKIEVECSEAVVKYAEPTAQHTARVL